MDKIIDFRMKVLVVDDFATMRKIVRNILKQIGFEDITEAEDGTVALRMIKSESVGLVVTDWNMPNMSGLDLLREIRQNPQTANLPVLMVTAEGLKENVMDAVKAGVKQLRGEALHRRGPSGKNRDHLQETGQRLRPSGGG